MAVRSECPSGRPPRIWDRTLSVLRLAAPARGLQSYPILCTTWLSRLSRLPDRHNVCWRCCQSTQEQACVLRAEPHHLCAQRGRALRLRPDGHEHHRSCRQPGCVPSTTLTAWAATSPSPQLSRPPPLNLAAAQGVSHDVPSLQPSVPCLIAAKRLASFHRIKSTMGISLGPGNTPTTQLGWLPER